MKDMAGALTPGQPIYVMFYAAAIIFFCFFYTALVFNSRETADNLKKSGAFIPGIRPGDHTAKFTSLLIIVVVTMDFMSQVQNYMMSQQYESLLKKANFKTTL